MEVPVLKALARTQSEGLVDHLRILDFDPYVKRREVMELHH